MSKQLHFTLTIPMIARTCINFRAIFKIIAFTSPITKNVVPFRLRPVPPPPAGAMSSRCRHSCTHPRECRPAPWLRASARVPAASSRVTARSCPQGTHGAHALTERARGGSKRTRTTHSSRTHPGQHGSRSSTGPGSRQPGHTAPTSRPERRDGAPAVTSPVGLP